MFKSPRALLGLAVLLSAVAHWFSLRCTAENRMCVEICVNYLLPEVYFPLSCLPGEVSEFSPHPLWTVTAICLLP